MRRLALIAALAAASVFASVPKAPRVCVDVPVLESHLCPDSDTRYVFTERAGCDEPTVVFQACADLPADADLRPEPIHCDKPGADPESCIEPGYDEHGPGPQEGPPGALPVDKPK